jgi:hypothetical protein
MALMSAAMAYFTLLSRHLHVEMEGATKSAVVNLAEIQISYIL